MDQLVHLCKENLRRGRGPLEQLTDEQRSALLERYARVEDSFDDDGFLAASRVVIHDLHTPRPFLHLMASGHFGLRDQWGSFWDQHCGGFSCVDSVLAGKMTSHLDSNYVPTSPAPQDVRGFYVHESGASWPMFPVAGWQEESYGDFQCVEGMDRFELAATRNELACRLSVLVHPELPLEVWQVTLQNRSDRARPLCWFARLRVNVDSYPFYYFVPRVVCQGIAEDGSLVFLNHDKNNKHPRAAAFISAEPMAGFDMMGEVFDGSPGRGPIPAAVRRGSCFNSPGLQPYAGLIAAAQYRADLAGGQERTWTLAYGKCPTDAAGREQFVRRVRREVLARPDRCRRALAEVWRKKVSAFAIRTPDVLLDRYFNVWSKYQVRNQGRFVRALDKVGYRDVLQDLAGMCDFEAPFVRARLLEALRYQFPDGRAVRQYECFPGGGHDARLYQDSPAWIPHALVRYVKETGDRTILAEEVPFLDPESLQVSDRQADSVYDHACLAVRSLWRNTGYHGLCRIGYGDWNDALSGIGGDEGVSVWLSCACVHAAKLMAELARFLGRGDDQEEFTDVARQMTDRINAHGWDGQWYVYAVNDRGQPIGSSSSPEGKIHLNVNTWALFTGVAAAAGRDDAVWQAIEKLATPVGHVLLAPPYTAASRDTVGRIADVAAGMFENGSIYTHGEAFYLYALAAGGKSDLWLAEIRKTLPGSLPADLTTCPPHQQSNFFVGPDHENFGQNLFSNFTGSVGWYRMAIEKIIGVTAEFEGLRIDPRPPGDWSRYQVKRTFRGSLLRIGLRRTGRQRVTLDGRRSNQVIPASQLQPGKQHVIEVEYP